MTTATLQIAQFNPHEASEADWTALNAFENRRLAEEWPGMPPRTLRRTKLDVRTPIPQGQTHLWNALAPESNEVVGSTSTRIRSRGSNEHLARFDIFVLPAFRRQGVASKLLGPVIDTARKANRRLLVTWGDQSVAAGEAFAKSLGARWGSTESLSRMALTDLDRELMRKWLQRAAERASEYALEFFDGAYPEDEIEAFVSLVAVMNTAPRDNREQEDDRITAELLRQFDVHLARREMGQWTMFARHGRSGKLAGYTQVVWDPENYTVLSQEDTGVVPEHRNRGLGRWLKAAMAEKLLQDLPGAGFILTSNAASNDAMLGINREMGFKLDSLVKSLCRSN